MKKMLENKWKLSENMKNIINNHQNLGKTGMKKNGIKLNKTYQKILKNTWKFICNMGKNRYRLLKIGKVPKIGKKLLKNIKKTSENWTKIRKKIRWKLFKTAYKN